MQNLNKEDANLRSFLDHLYIEKGLSQNTVKAYEADISALAAHFFKILKFLSLTTT